MICLCLENYRRYSAGFQSAIYKFFIKIWRSVLNEKIDHGALRRRALANFLGKQLLVRPSVQDKSIKQLSCWVLLLTIIVKEKTAGGG